MPNKKIPQEIKAMKRRTLFTLVNIAAVMFLFGLGTVNAQTYSGRATAIKTTVTIPGVTSTTTTSTDTGPLPGTGGNIAITRASANVAGIVTAGLSDASTMGSGNSSQSSASVNNLDVTVVGNTISADFISSSTQCLCTAGVPNCSGGSVITDLRINNISVTITGLPNQVINLMLLGQPVGTLIINEQLSTGAGDITVNALHIFVTDPITGVTTDVIIASAHSDIDCMPAMPTTETFSGRAYGVQSNVTTGILGNQTGTSTTITDTGDLPKAGGSIMASSATANIPGLLTTGIITAETSGGGISSQSSASVNNLNLSVVGIPITARVLTANTQCVCTVNGPTCSGNSVITDLVINSIPVTITGQPNQTTSLTVGTATISIIINEQLSTGPGDITVNALHVIVTEPLTSTTTDIIIASAHSDINCISVLAASVEVSGQVLNTKGRGEYRAVVTMRDFNGRVRSTTTNSFGYYKFDEVSVGETYVLTVNHRELSFTPQVIHLNEKLTRFDFIANP